MEDAALASEAPAERRLASTVDLREALGSDVLVHFRVKAPMVVTQDVKELAKDVGDVALQTLEQEDAPKESTFVARLSPRTRATLGEPLQLLVDTRHLHFFDPESGLGIYGADAA
jgi:multiple sugar transport system ATP-binding protein